MALLLVLMVLAGAWQAVEYFIDVERYRPLLIAELERVIGLPVAIGDIDLALLPTPHVAAHDVAVGEDDFKFEATVVDAQAGLSGLLKRAIQVPTIQPYGVVVTLPGDDAVLKQRLGDLVGHLSSAGGSDGGAGAWTVRGMALLIGRVRAHDIQVVRGKTLAARGDIEVRDPLSGSPKVDLDLRLPAIGEDTHLSAAFTVTFQDTGSPFLHGEATVENLDGEDLLGRPEIPHARARITAAVSGPVPEDIALDCSGQVAFTPTEDITAPLTAKVWWRNGAILVNDLSVTCPEFQFRGDVTVPALGPAACQIYEAQLRGRVLANVLEAFVPEQAGLQPGPNGTVVLRDWLLGTMEDGSPRLVQGTLDFEDLGVAFEDGSKTLGSLRGHIEVTENRFQITEVSGDGLRVAGTVQPDTATGSYAVDLTGEGDLAAPVAAWLLPQGLDQPAGTFQATRIAGTFVPGQGLPADLVVEGVIRDGAVGLIAGTFVDRWSGIQASFSTTGGETTGEATWSSHELGALQGRGSYTTQDGALHGTLGLDLERAAAAFPGAGEAQPATTALLRAYGPSVFAVTAQLPRPGANEVSVQAVRQGSPSLDTRVAFAEKDNAWALDALHVTGEVPLDGFAPLLPPSVQAVGYAGFDVQRNPGEERFAAHVTLDNAALAGGDHLRKRPGDPAQVYLEGGTPSAPWTPRVLQVRCLGEQVLFHYKQGGWRADNLNVHLTPLVRLLPDGASASGRVTGSLAFDPLDARLRLEQVALKLAPEVGVDAVDGAVLYHDGLWTFQDVRVLGADSDCTFNGGWQGRAWETRVTGPKLDLNTLGVLYGAARALRAPSDSATPPDPNAWRGTINLDVRELYYRRGRIEEVQAAITATPTELLFNDVRFRPYQGQVAGSARLTYAAGTNPGQLVLKLQSKDADLRVIDEMLLTEPRGMTGLADILVDLSMPVGAGAQPLNGLNGSVVFAARNGTFGKMGLATKVLAALRTTEVLHLARPSMKDEGLAFETSTGTCRMTNGVMALEELTIATKSYSIDGAGTVDFPQDQCNILLRVHLLGSVTGLAEKVPGVASTVDRLKEHTGLRLQLVGSPFDPEVRVESRSGSLRNLREGVGAAAESALEKIGL